MRFAGYVSICVQLYCVSCHCLTLHVSACTAILRRAGYFYFHIPEGICFAGLFCLSLQVVILCTFASVGWVKYEVLFIIIYLCYFCTVLYI
jgi:hypothetical protein